MLSKVWNRIIRYKAQAVFHSLDNTNSRKALECSCQVKMNGKTDKSMTNPYCGASRAAGSTPWMHLPIPNSRHPAFPLGLHVEGCAHSSTCRPQTRPDSTSPDRPQVPLFRALQATPGHKPSLRRQPASSWHRAVIGDRRDTSSPAARCGPVSYRVWGRRGPR